MRRTLRLFVAVSLTLAACGGGGGGGGGTPQPTATPTPRPQVTRTPGGGPQNTPTPSPDLQSTPTPTAVQGTRTATPAGQRTRTRTPTPDPATMKQLFVRQSGDDENPGTSADMAVRTIGRAAELMEPGTTVFVGPGRYPGRVSITGRVGSASLPIQLVADTSGTRTGDSPGAVMVDADGDIVALLITRSAYITLDSFFITGALPQTEPEMASATGIQLRAGSNNITIRNCIVGNAADADGIRVNASSDALIFNNLLLQNDRGVLITGDSQRTRVINNTIITHRRAGIALTESGGVGPTDTTVLNNLVQGNENNLAVSVAQSAADAYRGDFNLMFEPGLEDQTAIYNPAEIRGEHDINSDPLLSNVGQGDAHLEPDSPAINAGTDTIGSALVNQLLSRSTSPDGARDVAPVDIGYHY